MALIPPFDHPSFKLPEDEYAHITRLYADELKTFLADYKDFHFEGMGGSGIVLSAQYTRRQTRRAVKVPRKRLYEGKTADDVPPKGDPELQALEKVSHPNIIRLYDSLALKKGNGHCTVTDYVTTPRSLTQFAKDLCCTEACRKNDSVLSDNLLTLAHVLYTVADGIDHLHHTAKLIHFDIKPDNILVSASGTAFITDLGFARDITRYKPTEAVEIGFTWKYAHPFLTNPHSGARVSQTAAKCRNSVNGSELNVSFDIFALGRTIQEVLATIAGEFGDHIHSFYVCNYLHVVSCLCLDGENSGNGIKSELRSFASDRALGMPTRLFQAHKFSDIRDVVVALQRLLGLWQVERHVPELDRWSANTINVSDMGITTFTPRMSAVLQHPAFQRLAREKQLGMLDRVFPDGTHTRHQHSLGVFHAAAQYISGLYNDPENPTFRILVSPVDIRRLLAAALVHDLGQTSFGHDLEEVDESVFDHKGFVEDILKSKEYRDKKNRTLAQVLEGTEGDCWNVKTADVIALLRGSSRRPLDGALSEVLDGQLDADKLDYLIRDSVECRVAYGRGIDSERFFRSLTTAAVYDGKYAKLRLAIKQKGSASAEAFALARYQLYQSLYWHHTFRVIKGMLTTAVTATMEKYDARAGGGLFAGKILRWAYAKHVLGIDQPLPIATTGKPQPETAVAEALAKNPLPKEWDQSGLEHTVGFFYRLSSGKSRLLLQDLIDRNYYKRVYELSLGAVDNDSAHKLRELFQYKRNELQERIEDAFRKVLFKNAQTAIRSRESLVKDNVLGKLKEIGDRKTCFLIDLPIRGWAGGKENPIFVSDYKRRHFRIDVGGGEGADASTLWTGELGSMMRRIAFFRVFCEPEMHSIMARVVSAGEIADVLADALSEIRIPKVAASA